MDGAQTKSLDHRLLAIGIAAVAGGVYFIAVGFSLLSPPGRINGPLWLSTCCGLVFLLGGVSAALRCYLKMDASAADLPADTPRWVKLVWWGNTVAIICALASLGTWIAFGSGGAIHGPGGDGVGRIAFGAGAVISWLIAAAYARAGWRQVFDK